MAVLNTNLKLTPSKAKPTYGVKPPAVTKGVAAAPGTFTLAPGKTSPGGAPSVLGPVAAPSVTPVAPAVQAAPPPVDLVAQIQADPAYQAAVANSHKTRDDTLLQIANAEGVTKSSYGITDTSDPFSKAALLQKSLQDAIRGTTTSRFSAGMGYDASSQHAQDTNQTNYNQSYDSLVKAYNAALTDLGNQKKNAINNAGGLDSNAFTEALSRYLNTRPDPTASDTGGDTSGAAPAAAPAAGPAGYSGPRGLQGSGPNKGKYITANGEVLATQTKNGKTYYLNSKGGWTPVS